MNIRSRLSDLTCDFCLGAEPRFNLRDRILNAILLVCTVVALISLVLDIRDRILLDEHPRDYLFTAGTVVWFGGLYALGRRKPSGRWLVWPYIVSSLSAPLAAWFLMGGITGTTLLFAMAIIQLVPLITRGWERAGGILLLMTVMFVLFGLEYSGTVTISLYEDLQRELADTMVAFTLITLAYIIVISMVLKASQRKQVQIEELNRTKDKFLSIIGHDLRGPLGNLMSMSDILYQHELDPETRESLLQAIHSSSRQSFRLVENLLLWARAASGVMKAQPEHIRLAPLIDDAAGMMRENLIAKNIRFQVDISPDLQAWSDPDMLGTVLRNLLSNAVKFTPEGGQISISALADDLRGLVSVAVKDSGVGMEQDVVDRLLNFESSHSTRGTNNEEGTGLGLKLVQEFVEKNGGTLQISSAPNQGSCFTISLPSEPI